MLRIGVTLEGKCEKVGEKGLPSLLALPALFYLIYLPKNHHLSTMKLTHLFSKPCHQSPPHRGRDALRNCFFTTPDDEGLENGGSKMSSTFISLVGYQPSAVAVPLASWINANPKPSEVVLLATEKMKSTADRLKSWIQETCQIPSVCILISSDQVLQDEVLAFSGTVKSVLNENPDQQFVFNAQPGLTAHVVIFAQALPEGSIFLHSMVDKLYTCQIVPETEQWDEREHVDIGLKALLDLYDMQFSITGDFPDLIHQVFNGDIPPNVYSGLKFSGTQVQFDLAFEKAGFFYGLKVIEGENTLQQIRSLRRIQNELSGLQPQIAVLTPKESILARARKAKFLAINSQTKPGKRRFLKWIKREILPPGLETSSKIPMSQKPLQKVFSGTGGSGPPLAVCLGDDPSATLISLCTHKPKQAWVFYDSTTQLVMEVAHRLKDEIRNLPVGEIKFLKTDYLGRKISTARFDNLKDQIRVDVTPGTKAQGCALARIPNAELWSLRGDLGEANCISDTTKSLALWAPDILTQARCCGGALVGSGRDAKSLQGQKGFLNLLAQFLRRYLEQHSAKGLGFRDLECDGGYLKVYSNYAEVKLDDEIKKGSLNQQDKQGGYWFELLVANAFLEAGADEVHRGVKWDWPKKRQFKGAMTEVDVLARFNHRFIAISCKIGPKIAQPKREIEAVARTGMGRFCLPILARPKVSAGAIKQSIEANKGAVVLDLQYMAKPEVLSPTLEQIFSNRSTVTS